MSILLGFSGVLVEAWGKKAAAPAPEPATFPEDYTFHFIYALFGECSKTRSSSLPCRNRRTRQGLRRRDGRLSVGIPVATGLHAAVWLVLVLVAGQKGMQAHLVTMRLQPNHCLTQHCPTQHCPTQHFLNQHCLPWLSTA